MVDLLVRGGTVVTAEGKRLTPPSGAASPRYSIAMPPSTFSVVPVM